MRSLSMRTSLLVTAAVGLCVAVAVGGLSVVRMSTIADRVHEPHGYVWQGVAQLVVDAEPPHMRGRFADDPEAGMFCAYGTDRGALEELATHLAAVATDAGRARLVVTKAEAEGFEFDD